MKSAHKIIALLNLLLLGGIVFAFISPNFILTNVDITLVTGLVGLIILILFFWGIINAIGYLGGYPVALDQLATIEKILALIPVFNFVILSSIVFLLFMLS